MDERLKDLLLRKLRDRFDLQRLGRTDSQTTRDEVLILIRSLCNNEIVPISFAEREQLAREILDEIYGLGPLEPLLKDPTVSDILVRRFDRVYVERGATLELTSYKFEDDQHLMQIIDRIVSRVGRRISESSPLIDAWLADGSHLTAVIPPLAIEGPCLFIRRSRGDSVAVQQVVENKTAQSIEAGESGGVLGISVAVLSEQEERQLLLQRLVHSTQVARVVFGHVGLPIEATDPILRQIQQQRAEVVIVDVSPDDPQRAIHTIELIRDTTSDIAIFAVGDMRNPNTIVSAMRAGAREFIERPTTATDLLEAFIRLSGARRKAPSDSGPSGGSVPPGGSAPPSGSSPPGVPLGVRRTIRPRTPPPRKMARGA